MSKPEDDQLTFRGYVKQEGDEWVAICIDLNLAAQGDTAEEAIMECSTMIEEYLNYIVDTYPDKLNEYLSRPAPPELMSEYNYTMAASIIPQSQASHSQRYTHPFRLPPPQRGMMNA